MSIGIDFILRANSAAFTKGLAAANNGIRDLKKEMRESGGRRFTEALGIYGIVRGFRAVIDSAQETRKSMEGMGKPVSDSVRSVAELGDAFDSAKKGVMDFGVSALSVFTRFGESVGNAINLVRKLAGAKLDDSPMAAQTERDADKSVGESNASVKKIEAANNTEALRAAAANLAAVKKKNAREQMNDKEKLDSLLEERTALNKRIHDMPQFVREKNPLLMNKLQVEKENLDADITKTQDKQREGNLKGASEYGQAQEKLFHAQDKMQDKVLPTLHDLAGSASEGYRHIDPAKIAQAKKVEELEAKGEQMGYAGNFKGMEDNQQAAAKIRAGLRGSVKSDDIDQGKSYIDAIKNVSDAFIAFTKTKTLVVTEVGK